MSPLGRFWIELGHIRWPLAFSALVVIVLAAWSAWRLVTPGTATDPRTKAWIDAVLFWGGFALVTGVLGTLVGVSLAAQAIQTAGEAPPGLVWGGIRVALSSTVLGCLVLGVASLAWFGLQLRWRHLVAREASAA